MTDKTNREIELIWLIAQAWCLKENNHKEMDVELVCEIARIVYKNELEMREPYLGCATTRELLNEIRARIETDGNLDYKTVESDD